MPGELTSWPRPHFAPGGGNPLVFYALFGTFNLNPPMSRSKYRSAGPGEWLEVMHYERAKHPEVFADFQSGPMWELLKRDSPLTAAKAEQSPQAVALQGEATDSNTLDYFRDTIGIVTWLLDAGGIAVYDPQMLWLWSADEWRDEVFASEDLDPQAHTVILVSDDDRHTRWLHTRGMRKFGRPDISVHGVGPTFMDAVTQLIERFIDYQANGGVIPDGEEVRMTGLPPGGVCHRLGTVDDPDFNNVHVEIEWEAEGIGR
ncbi:MAG: hypothetical protein L0241_16185 [Planctomycetia bacterium]|nr:hypothetical protein [Planctomycetia bacterium]